MSDKLFNKLQQVLEVKLEEIKDEVYSSIQNVKNDFETILDDILEEVAQETRLENEFTVGLDTFKRILLKGRVIKLEGSVYDPIAVAFSSPDQLFLNDRGVIRPPLGTLDDDVSVNITEIELVLPSGKVLDTKEVKELFVD